MRILVTGGAGFIGSHFVRTLLSDDPTEVDATSVTVLDKLTYCGNPANVAPVEDDPRYRFVHGDIADAELVDQLLAEHDVVVHFAAESHVDRSIANATPFVTTNVLGTHTLLGAALKHGIDRFLHVSTDEVYGSIAQGAWPEDWPLAPNSPYAASKASADLLVLSYHRTYGMDVVVTRCSNNYGPYHFPEKMIPLFITSLLDGRKVPLYGDGSNVREWLHVSDHCRGIGLVLAQGRAGGVYNIGGGKELTNKELASRLLELCGGGWDMVEYVEDRQGHDLRYALDTSKISKELGYAARIPFDEGLASTVQWYRDNRAWWEPLTRKAGLS
jgi:dTDP-glucose 4,6-dehydratase